MTYYYSSQTNCLYMDGIPPDGSVEITGTYYQELIAGMQNGKVVISDEKGYPILVDAPPPTAEQNKATASSLLTGTDWTTIADVANPETIRNMCQNAKIIINCVGPVC